MPLIDRRVAASLAACVLFLGPFVLAQRALAQQGAAYWKFDEGSGNVAHDSSGNHNDGTIVKAAWAEGASGKALAFRDYAAGYPSKPASESEYVLVKHSPGLTPHKSFEVSATINVDPGFEPSFAAGIVQKGSGYGCSFRVLLRSDLHIQATVGQEHNSVVSQSAVARGKWTTIRVTYDGNQVQIFIDGKQDGSLQVSGARLESEEDITIGTRFSGRIDEIKIQVQ